MVQINFALKEVNCKVVFYGPGMSGKTTNLEIVHQKAPEENKGELTAMEAEVIAEESEEEDDDAPIYNPLNLPLCLQIEQLRSLFLTRTLKLQRPQMG